MFWTKGTIRAILNNSLYRGTMIYGKARYSEIGKKSGKVPRPRTVRALPCPRPGHHPCLLAGVIRCGGCEKGFVGKKQVRGKVETYYNPQGR